MTDKGLTPLGVERSFDRVILASASPRRRALLAVFPVAFRVIDPPFDEDRIDIRHPEQYARLSAAGKARSVAVEHPRSVVISADTVVSLGDRMMGKPRDARDAHAMLTALSGRTHSVLTAVAVRCEATGQAAVDVETTAVTFHPLSRRLIGRYVETGEALDKAGAYAIQGAGAIFVRRIEGCYFNVVGLPLSRLARMLSSFDVNLL